MNPPEDSVTTQTEAQSGTVRTLERDLKVAVTVIVAGLLTVLAWKVALDATNYLAAEYGGNKMRLLRAPLFLGLVLVIAAGAVSYASSLLGKKVRNLILDSRNLQVAQWILLGCALMETGAILLKKYGGKAQYEIREYSLVIVLVLAVILLQAIRRAYTAGSYVALSEGRTLERGTEKSGAGRILVLVLLAILLYFGWNFARGKWEGFALAEARRRTEATQAAAIQLEAVRIASLPPPGAWVATNRYGLQFVSLFTGEFRLCKGEASQTFTVVEPEGIVWGTKNIRDRERLIRLRNGAEVPPQPPLIDKWGKKRYRRLPDKDSATYTFVAKDDLTMWVAIGVPYREE